MFSAGALRVMVVSGSFISYSAGVGRERPPAPPPALEVRSREVRVQQRLLIGERKIQRRDASCAQRDDERGDPVALYQRQRLGPCCGVAAAQCVRGRIEYEQMRCRAACLREPGLCILRKVLTSGPARQGERVRKVVVAP